MRTSRASPVRTRSLKEMPAFRCCISTSNSMDCESLSAALRRDVLGRGANSAASGAWLGAAGTDGAASHCMAATQAQTSSKGRTESRLIVRARRWSRIPRRQQVLHRSLKVRLHQYFVGLCTRAASAPVSCADTRPASPGCWHPDTGPRGMQLVVTIVLCTMYIMLHQYPPQGVETPRTAPSRPARTQQIHRGQARPVALSCSQALAASRSTRKYPGCTSMPRVAPCLRSSACARARFQQGTWVNRWCSRW